MATQAVLKWHGGKHYLARRIVELFPPHVHYVEPYAGGLAVLLARDPEGVSEVANDLHGDLANFWKVLQGGATFPRFVRLCQATPFAEAEWREAAQAIDQEADPVMRAWRFFVVCRLSLAGRMRSFTGVTKSRTRRGMNNEVSAWLSAVDGLAAVHERLRRVLVLNRPALEVIRGQDGSDTLFYLDPPYLHSTRVTTGDYRHEMTREDHAALLEAIRGVRGKVILSGYPSDMYDTWLAGWRAIDHELPNHAASGSGKRRMIERLWLNF